MSGEKKAETAEPRRKRKRGPARAKNPAQEERPVLTDANLQAIYRDITRRQLPRIYAAEARRSGDPAISPRDFHCECFPSWRDFAPVCENKKPGCRYAGRLAPEDEDAHFDDRLSARFKSRIEKARARVARPRAPGRRRAL